MRDSIVACPEGDGGRICDKTANMMSGYRMARNWLTNYNKHLKAARDKTEINNESLSMMLGSE
jgi:hypothetical protein